MTAEPVSWDLARKVAAQLLRMSPELDPSTRARVEADFAELAPKAERLVEAATGLVSNAGPPNAVVTDRLGWVDANIASFRRLLGPIAERLATRDNRKPSVVSAATSGAEVGLVLAWISSRVLGQYDLLPGEDAAGSDAIYFVAPNVVALERRHGFAPREFRLWIAVHEVTHRVQFTGVPWLRPYFLDLVERGTRLAPPDARTVLDSLKRAVGDLREGRNPIADGGVVSLLASSEQLATLREAQALMSLLEGHGDVVMANAGGDSIPGAARFARVLSERRQHQGGLGKMVQQALGIEAKLRQYEEGERFVEAVIEAGGDELLARIWSDQSLLPTMEEIRQPDRWLDRAVGEAAHAS